MTGDVEASGDDGDTSTGDSTGSGATVVTGVSEVSGAGTSITTMSEPGREIGGIDDVALSAAGSGSGAGTVADGELEAGTVVEEGTPADVHK